MGKLQTGRFERLAARTYSIKGPGALVDLDETVLGVLQLERQAGMEAHLIQEWETFGHNIVSANAAAAFSYCLLSNPVGSNRLMVIDGWQRGRVNAALEMKIHITRGVPPGFVAATVAPGIDSRIPASRQPSGRLFSQQTNITSFGTQIGDQLDTGWINYQVVLAPDGSLVWRGSAHNEALGVSVRWAERDAAPFEL